ncbi:hypothetical protein C1H57_02930 [Clostridium sp. 2-1]|uniref:hypothetical protein n=1 Tax=Clostridium TaxID=1485 RepID=UPI000CDA1C05|nr:MULTISPECIES: hypothetical protein [Clostridium]MBN7573933.1 hypothetical protein [Clostridium beijerinckii]MBN7577613.1 hypothetical protein [Clostridium beijerinckii]MBN7583683.1 hypothetical protein [Clostridium beijerinckii]MBO0519895.1 hypothetical protein [Clostridium beijerinckii]POO92773.1 hypothetical protein C1H57_02930 [Clostridium sp. 2-1]
MINIIESTIIYVLCPFKTKTGGTELLHQLVYELNKNGHNAHIVYVGANSKLVNNVTSGFENYIDKPLYIDEIIDSKDNILVVPEIFMFDMKKNYNNIQKILWWLSVDNFVKNNGMINHFRFWGLLRTISHTIKHLYKLKPIKNFSSFADLHLCQCHYAIDFLVKSGVSENRIEYLSDYINDIYFSKKSFEIEREDIVLYNPKKGYNFTRKLIEAAPDIKWIPLINLTTDQVQELLAKGKIYIDFGNHPGKDRFPREAAISGCCIITSKKGSAAYYEDVMIPDKFKFECSEKNINLIISEIKQCLSNHDEYLEYYKEYREMIKNEKEVFLNDVIKIFGKGFLL